MRPDRTTGRSTRVQPPAVVGPEEDDGLSRGRPEHEVPGRQLGHFGLAFESGPVGIVVAALAGEHDRVHGVGGRLQARKRRIRAPGAGDRRHGQGRGEPGQQGEDAGATATVVACRCRPRRLRRAICPQRQPIGAKALVTQSAVTRRPRGVTTIVARTRGRRQTTLLAAGLVVGFLWALLRRLRRCWGMMSRGEKRQSRSDTSFRRRWIRLCHRIDSVVAIREDLPGEPFGLRISLPVSTGVLVGWGTAVGHRGQCRL